MTCCLHVGDELDEKITSFSEVSWAKILVCVKRWNVSNVSERNISLNLHLLLLNELTKLPLAMLLIFKLLLKFIYLFFLSLKIEL